MIGHDPWGREIDDPLPDAIKAYHDGEALFTDCDIREGWPPYSAEAHDKFLGQPLAVLTAWDQPALTCEGAAEALRFAQEEIKEGGNYANTMIAAALGLS